MLADTQRVEGRQTVDSGYLVFISADTQSMMQSHVFGM